MQCELRTDKLTLGRWHIGKWVSPEHAAIESGPDTWDENKKEKKKESKKRPTTERINGEDRDPKRQTDDWIRGTRS